MDVKDMERLSGIMSKGYCRTCRSRRRMRRKRNMVEHILERKLNLFGRKCRMKDNVLVKDVIFRTMYGDEERKTLWRMVKRHQGGL